MSNLTDNNMKVYKVQINVGTATKISQEVDLELPRGFVAKIHFLDYWVEGWEAIAAANVNQRSNSALVRDPDDETTSEIPQNRTQHDVIAEFQTTIMMDAADDFALLSADNAKQIRFDQSEELDVISFRNMRFNGVGENGSGVGMLANLAIYYTLEEVKDQDILELLDIL